MKTKQITIIIILQFLFKLKSMNNYQWKWDWWCVSINLYYSYIKHTKICRKRLRLDYWFSNWYNFNISKYNPLAGSTYMKIPKETIQESKMRYLNPVDHNQRRITKPNKEFAQKIDFKNIKFPVKIRDIHKIEK